MRPGDSFTLPSEVDFGCEGSLASGTVWRRYECTGTEIVKDKKYRKNELAVVEGRCLASGCETAIRVLVPAVWPSSYAPGFVFDGKRKVFRPSRTYAFLPFCAAHSRNMIDSKREPTGMSPGRPGFKLERLELAILLRAALVPQTYADVLAWLPQLPPDVLDESGYVAERDNSRWLQRIAVDMGETMRAGKKVGKGLLCDIAQSRMRTFYTRPGSAVYDVPLANRLTQRMYMEELADAPGADEVMFAMEGLSDNPTDDEIAASTPLIEQARGINMIRVAEGLAPLPFWSDERYAALAPGA
jgi:hypothetical protein